MTESANRYRRKRSQQLPAPRPQPLTEESLPLLAKKNGRPFAIPGPETNPEAFALRITMLRCLGQKMATSKECAAAFDVTEMTLFAFFKRHPEARDAWESGKEVGKVSLRRSQMKLAERNAAMATFLGLNYLDQTDRRPNADAMTSASVTSQVTVIRFGEDEGKV